MNGMDIDAACESQLVPLPGGHGCRLRQVYNYRNVAICSANPELSAAMLADGTGAIDPEHQVPAELGEGSP
jgi:hypothetical protein